MNGWPLPVRSGSGRERLPVVGEPQTSFLGRPLQAPRGSPRSFSFTLPALERADADTVEALLDGRGHHMPCDFDAWSDAGLGPDSPSGAYEIAPRVPNVAGMFGAGFLSVTSSIIWNPQLGDRWTVMFWRDVAVVENAQHVAVRSDGAVFFDGVLDEGASMPTELLVEQGGVGLLPGDYDDIVILPVVASDEFIASTYRWCLERGLCFAVPVADATGREVLHDEAPTIVGAPVARVGGVAGGCIWAGARTDRLVFTAGAAAAAAVFARDELSAEAWLQPGALATGDGTIVGNFDGSTGWALQTQLVAGRLVARGVLATAAGLVEAVSATAIDPAGPPTHLAMTWARAGGALELFVNGRPAALASSTGHPGSAASDDSANDVVVNGTPGDTDDGVVGRISEPRVYRMALTETEVLERYRMGRAGAPGGLPRPFSALPRLVLEGDVVSGRGVEVLGRVAGQPIVTHGAHKTPGWHTNSRDVSAEFDVVIEDPRERLPLPIWSFLADERFVDGGALRPVYGHAFGLAGVVGTRVFTRGPFNLGRARSFNGDAARRLSLPAGYSVSATGLHAVTMLAWVRRDSIAATARGVLYLGGPLSTRLSLGITSGHQIRASARGQDGDTLQVWTSTPTLVDTDGFHLVGAGIDLLAGKTSIFVDDAGLALVPEGFFQVGTFTPPTLATFDDTTGAGSAIGVDAASSGNPWSGDIATVALYPGLLSAQTINAIWRAGRRGAFL